jgi:hypothetical protein
MRKPVILATLLCFGLAAFATDPPSKKAESFIVNLTTLLLQECENPCPYDLDGDGGVHNPDLLAFLGQFGVDTDLGCEEGDFDEDGVVGIDDFRVFIPHHGTICD